MRTISMHFATFGIGQSADNTTCAGPNGTVVSRMWAGEIKGELLHIWDRQDPHVLLEGRNLIHAGLEEAGVGFQWHEVNVCETKGRETIRLTSAMGLCSNCFTAGSAGETCGPNRLDQRKPATECGILYLKLTLIEFDVPCRFVAVAATD
jgi:hypothetical protein